MEENIFLLFEAFSQPAQHVKWHDVFHSLYCRLGIFYKASAFIVKAKTQDVLVIKKSKTAFASRVLECDRRGLLLLKRENAQ